MSNQSTQTRIVLLGLDDALAAELASALAGREWIVYARPFLSPRECLGVVQQVRADLVFCSAERERYLALLEALAGRKLDLPVVVVSRRPEVSEWLDAIEAGASDYCASPFEATHLRWILDSVLNHRSSPELRRAAS